MKYFGLAAAALIMTISASADTVTEICGSFNNSNPTTTQTGTITCNAFSTLGTGGTVTGAFLVYASDYSNGVFTNQTEMTTYTFSGATLVNQSDTVTTTGGTSSAGETSSLAAFQAPNAPALAGFYDNVTAGIGNQISAAYSNQMTVGNAFGATGYVQEIFTYTPGTSTTPEPGSMMLLGSGLVAFAIAGRKLVRK